LIGKIMGGNPVFRGTRVPVHMLAELVPSRACARTRYRRGSVTAARETPDHPDVGTGSETVHINGPLCTPTYAVGSAEWAEQQQGDAND
jgi:hypothetical protein